jgi:ketosteroid isomerase-like protein
MVNVIFVGELNYDETTVTNAELIKKFYIAFKNKDEKTYMDICDENIEWITMDEMPNGGKYIGRTEVFENYFPNMLSNFKEFHAIPEQITCLKDHVMVIGRYQGISKGDKKFDVSFSHVYLIKENKIKQFRQFTDAQKIQESLN